MPDDPSTHEPHPIANDEITWSEVAGWLEFGCWTTLLLTPFLYYINGPAVSRDQLVMRCLLVSTAALGAITLSLHRWLRLGG